MAILGNESLSKAKSRVKKYFGNGATGEKFGDVTDTMEHLMPSFAKEVYDTRRGMQKDEYGNTLMPYSVSLSEAASTYFGLESKEKQGTKSWDVDIINQFLKHMNVRTKQLSLQQIAQRFGKSSLGKMEMEDLLIQHSSFNNPAETGNIQSDYRFIIPELFTTAINTAYKHDSLHQNWIANTTNMGQQEITMPQILRGDGMPTKVAEGADIPMGSVRFGKKKVDIFKVGTGFSITDELMMASTLDMIFIFLQEVGNDMSIGADTQAMKVLVEGEQANLSESAPVIGVEDTASGYQHIDIDRVVARMAALKTPVTRVVAAEGDSLQDLNESNTNRDRQTVGQYINQPVDNYVLPEDQMLFLNASRAMTKLQYGGFKTERRRNPQNQTEELFISDWINFAIIKRDARILVDKSVTFAANGFPSYMDVYARMAQSFKEF